jgi:hypothetical protein
MVYIVIWIALAAIAAGIAQMKGRNALLWGGLGLVGGLITVIVVACMPRVNDIPGQYFSAPGTPASASLASQLERLADLRRKGALTEEEFETQKRKLIAG